MSILDDLFANSRSASDIIDGLMDKSVCIPDWKELVNDYEPAKHKIVDDKTDRVDKILEGGKVEKASRIYVGLEKLLVNRMSEYMFAIPVQRVYSGLDNDTRKQIADAIEKIYKHARIDTMNLKRGVSYFGACEFCTIWYAVKKPNTLYGFNSEYKLKCTTFTPMDGTDIYPLFDEYGDMLALSIHYKRKVRNEFQEFFETYTDKRHIKWQHDGEWKELVNDEIEILKIPAIYGYRNKPIYDGLSYIREEIEYTLSRNSDVIAYNSAPIIKVVGQLQGEEKKGESQRIMRVQEGGDVSYVSWTQSTEAMRYHVETLTKMFWSQAQMPDISFDNMARLGSIGYDARKTMFADAELKVGDEKGIWIELLERECNVIKAFLAKMNVKWEKDMDGVQVEHVITAFRQDDEKSKIEMFVTANGGKPLISHRESIEQAGMSADPDKTFGELQAEQAASAMARVNSLYEIAE